MDGWWVEGNVGLGWECWFVNGIYIWFTVFKRCASLELGPSDTWLNFKVQS